jgi:hypothetical protein
MTFVIYSSLLYYALYVISRIECSCIDYSIFLSEKRVSLIIMEKVLCARMFVTSCFSLFVSLFKVIFVRIFPLFCSLGCVIIDNDLYGNMTMLLM